MAAPHVTGAVALCLQGAPCPLTAEEIRALLTRDGRAGLRQGEAVQVRTRLPQRQPLGGRGGLAWWEGWPVRPVLALEAAMRRRHEER